MKQYITSEQWEELNDEQKEKIKNFFTPEQIIMSTLLHRRGEFQGFDTLHTQRPTMTIGEMIEFLGNNWYYNIDDNYVCPTCAIDQIQLEPDKLCNALWRAVKKRMGQEEE